MWKMRMPFLPSLPHTFAIRSNPSITKDAKKSDAVLPSCQYKKPSLNY
ncbi:hypothetical protein MARINOS108_10695 [Marinoscillum sp. 108]|nr:hypothetical protein MARINOS108_10695 [Marinoscillum sp. 108]